MKINKSSEFNVVSKGSFDSDDLAKKIGREIGIEFRKALDQFKEDLKELSFVNSNVYTSKKKSNNETISMDESIIPTSESVVASGTNISNAGKEEKTVDKNLSKSKSKLAGILKKRKD